MYIYIHYSLATEDSPWPFNGHLTEAVTPLCISMVTPTSLGYRESSSRKDKLHDLYFQMDMIWSEMDPILSTLIP